MVTYYDVVLVAAYAWWHAWSTDNVVVFIKSLEIAQEEYLHWCDFTTGGCRISIHIHIDEQQVASGGRNVNNDIAGGKAGGDGSDDMFLIERFGQTQGQRFDLSTEL